MRLPYTHKLKDLLVKKNFEAIERGGAIDFPEVIITNPEVGSLRLYAEDNGAGKTRLAVRDSAGNSFVIWTQP